MQNSLIPTPPNTKKSPLNRAYLCVHFYPFLSKIGGKFSEVRICVTEDANKWLNTSVMWANMPLLDFLYPLSTWTTFEPPKTSKSALMPKMEAWEKKKWSVDCHTCLIHAKNFTEIAMKIQGKTKKTFYKIIRVCSFSKKSEFSFLVK